MVTADELPPPTPAPTVVSPPPAVPTTAPTFLQEAPAFGTNIVVTGDLYDTRTAADNGCDPAGCVPMNIRVSEPNPLGMHGWYLEGNNANGSSVRASVVLKSTFRKTRQHRFFSGGALF